MRKAGDTSPAAAPTPPTIRKACEAYARKYIDIQRTQFKRLGVLGDWDNPYLTLNKEYEADELRLFADIVEKGFVYRGKKPVYWSIPAAPRWPKPRSNITTTSARAFREISRRRPAEKTFIVIWTTTPWTLPANLAVAYNENFPIRPGRSRRTKNTFFRGLLPAVAEKCGWSGYTEHPFPDRGTGQLNISIRSPQSHRQGCSPPILSPATPARAFVHIAPGHGLDDYNLGRQNGLPIYSPVDDDGKFAYTNDLPVEQQMPPKWSANPFSKNTARATPTKPCCTNCASATPAAPGKLSSQLSALLAQQNAHHLPRDGPVVHQD
jgi:isoleucyl-tRNA synthetase